MEPRDWLLLLLGFAGGSPSPAMDPVRIQKGMFLLAQEGDLPASEVYAFAPYNWGPYSRDLRADLDRLVHQGFVQARPVQGYSWKRYGLTVAGAERARELLQDAARDAALKVVEIKQRVSAATFNDLLNDVYTAYPDYAVNSLFRA